MITYLYWLAVIFVAGSTVWLFSRKGGLWPSGFIAAGMILIIGWAAFFFYFEQVFVKRYGGVMTIATPPGQQHLGSTWKDDNLWIENYDPKTDTCIFTEYSKGNLLQGRVTIKECNPIQK